MSLSDLELTGPGSGRPPAGAGSVVEQRIVQVAPLILGPEQYPARPTLDSLLAALVPWLGGRRDPAGIWLLHIAMTGAMPSADEVMLLTRQLELRTPANAQLWLMNYALEAAIACPTGTWPIEIVSDVVVDVDFSAQHDLHTGIQRVVRTTVPRWAQEHDIVPVVWSAGHRSLRRLTAVEHDRVFRWEVGGSPGDHAGEPTIVVPWKTTIVLPEVPNRAACELYAAVGRFKADRVVAIGYDAIPVISADLVPIAEPNRFVHYLTAVKHMSAVVGISISATEEFRGFADALGSQGLAGPEVSECNLPVDIDTQFDSALALVDAHDSDAIPLVVCVGSFEPRKNQLAVLWAAEVLWREGHRFRLRFIGGGGWGSAFPTAVRRAQRAGRPVEVLTATSEQELDRSYRQARFTVFVSVHEGYGLPVAESLARNTPVVVTDFGSTKEIGADGGVLAVDPRDDYSILDGMRSLLTDDALLDELTLQIQKRPQRTWDDYAAQLWTAFGLPKVAS
ncbi:MAG: glycosyltransferase family 1 protein [Pseudonocardiales bacterium]|nr:glycosyltransferase family 1 protein [Pseudonocardiales bacterium]